MNEVTKYSIDVQVYNIIFLLELVPQNLFCQSPFDPFLQDGSHQFNYVMKVG